ncbi:hypothetical protein D3C85_1580490 [compost metagenome]
MAHYVVHRRTYGFGETVVAHITGNSILHIDDVFDAEAVEFIGGDSNLNVRCNHRQNFSGQLSSNARQCYLC